MRLEQGRRVPFPASGVGAGPRVFGLLPGLALSCGLRLDSVQRTQTPFGQDAEKLKKAEARLEELEDEHQTTTLQLRQAEKALGLAEENYAVLEVTARMRGALDRSVFRAMCFSVPSVNLQPRSKKTWQISMFFHVHANRTHVARKIRTKTVMKVMKNMQSSTWTARAVGARAHNGNMGSEGIKFRYMSPR